MSGHTTQDDYGDDYEEDEDGFVDDEYADVEDVLFSRIYARQGKVQKSKQKKHNGGGAAPARTEPEPKLDFGHQAAWQMA